MKKKIHVSPIVWRKRELWEVPTLQGKSPKSFSKPDRSLYPAQMEELPSNLWKRLQQLRLLVPYNIVGELQDLLYTYKNEFLVA